MNYIIVCNTKSRSLRRSISRRRSANEDSEYKINADTTCTRTRALIPKIVWQSPTALPHLGREGRPGILVSWPSPEDNPSEFCRRRRWPCPFPARNRTRLSCHQKVGGTKRGNMAEGSGFLVKWRWRLNRPSRAVRSPKSGAMKDTVALEMLSEPIFAPGRET